MKVNQMADNKRRLLHGNIRAVRTTLIVFIILSLSVVFFVPKCDAIILFHKPAYKGRIIDMETKEPIEGVAVVAVYRIDNIWGYPGGAGDKRIHAQEALTDKDGYFHIPAYTRLVGLNSKASYTDFIIFKPGYASYPKQRMQIIPFQHCGPAWLFVGKTGTTKEINKKSYENGIGKVLPEKIKITFGIAELPKVNTWEERRKACSISRPDFKLPILYQMIEKEIEWIYTHQGWRRQ